MNMIMSWIRVIPADGPGRESQRKNPKEEQPENRSQPPKVGLREFLELIETRPFPETIDGEQQMIV